MKRNLKRKSIWIPVALILSGQVQAQDQRAGSGREARETLIHTTESQLKVEINKDTVLCSRADYDRPRLKVLIPPLADVTLLDHQNRGAGFPCVTTGEACQLFPGESGTPAAANDIIQGRPGVETILVRVTALRVDTIDHDLKTCETELREKVNTEIRGRRLYHERTSSLGFRQYRDCLGGMKP